MTLLTKMIDSSKCYRALQAYITFETHHASTNLYSRVNFLLPTAHRYNLHNYKITAVELHRPIIGFCSETARNSLARTTYLKCKLIAVMCTDTVNFLLR